tara:strand:- start:872 stop:2179 length:1308 start_codon:yes stop_codon:yes gene_type:complete
MKKVYVLDTNVLLTDHKSIYGYANNDIVIPLKVLEEIDKHKKRHDGVGVNARGIIRILDNLRAKGNLHKGVRLRKGKGIVCVRGFDPKYIPADLDWKDADNQIICTALTEKASHAKRKVIMVSRDINMRVKCDSLEMLCEDFSSDKVVHNVTQLYSGFTSHLVDDQLIDQFYSGEDIFFDKEDVKLLPQQFVMLVSNQNEKKSALAKFIGYNAPLKRVHEPKRSIWGLKPRNKEQQFALDLLLDPEVPIVTIIGKAGCGKTLLAIASGLELVVEQDKYKKLVVSRPVQPLGKDIGFLPGSMEEKMRPWLMPIQDNIDFLLNGKKENLDFLYDKKIIEVEALTYIRGRSISGAFIIIDEAQNLTTHELKTIITRVGEGSKIILTGDIEQIDSVYLDSTSNGLSYAIEKFKTHNLAGHMTLQKGERSKVATLAAKIL